MAGRVQIVWTPWRNERELLDVRGWLFPQSFSGESTNINKRRACGQISAWKVRGNLPHAVESAWFLTEAILMDEMECSHASPFALQASYITAISRFVTGLLDSQQDAKYKVSMYAKAQQIGLPAVFVDLRHEATHGDMPSLTNLRSAASRALQWLWLDFWKTLDERYRDQDVKEAFKVTNSAFNLRQESKAEQETLLDPKEKEAGERIQRLVEKEVLEESARNEGTNAQAEADAANGGEEKMTRNTGGDEELLRVDGNAEKGGWAKWQGPWKAKGIGIIK